MILSALWRALPQVFHPAARVVLLKSLALTLLLFAALGGGGWIGLRYGFTRMGWGEGGYAQVAIATLIALATTWLLFRAVAMAVLGLFSDAIVEAVEAEDYPAAARVARPLSWAAGIRIALRSLGRAIGWNLLALPLYIVLLVTGIGTLALFLAVNAYLLGRDLAEMVESRHPELPPIPAATRLLMGLVSALLFLLPVANLLAPIWSAAMAVHVLHRRRKGNV
ncbi:hypothetical protein BH10PSE12_BH10PSE12_14260 [soil metagenome]